MADDSSEEKKHDASSKKLSDSRDKGQVPTAKEAVQSLAIIFVLAYIFLNFFGTGNALSTLFRPEFYDISEPATTVFKMRFLEATQVVLSITFGALILAALVGAGLTLMISGFVFSFESLNPDLNKINPVKGAGRVFGIQGMKTFGMNILRLVLLVAAGGGTAYLLLPRVFSVHSCSFECGTAEVGMVILYSVGAMMLVMLMMSVLDYLVSTQEFLRQQKMTETERKKEQKDMMGSPELRGVREELRQDTLKTIGPGYATFIVDNGHGKAVAVHYQRGVTDWPIVVAKSSNKANLLRMARRSGAPVVTDATAAEVIRYINMGDQIFEEHQIQAIMPYIQEHAQ